MLSLDNQTAFVARAVPLREKEGHPAVIFIAKGTYSLTPDGVCSFAKVQSPLAVADEHYGDPQATSVRQESDLAIYKPATDVILLGSAYAPSGKPVRQLDVSLRVGSLQRRLRVFGNRQWKAGVLGASISSPDEFAKLPLTFENAFGGKDVTNKNPAQHGFEARNPVGKGYRVNTANETEKGKTLDSWPLPNLEDPAHLIRSWKDKPAPAAPGFVCRSWLPRRPLAGTYDDRWMDKRCPILPADFDYRYFQSAPSGQVCESYLKGGETVELENLTPQGRLAFALPQVRLGLETRCLRRTHQQELVLDTVVLLTDLLQCQLVWRARVRYRHSLDEFDWAYLYDLNGPGIREDTTPEEPEEET